MSHITLLAKMVLFTCLEASVGRLGLVISQVGSADEKGSPWTRLLVGAELDRVTVLSKPELECRPKPVEAVQLPTGGGIGSRM